LLAQPAQQAFLAASGCDHRGKDVLAIAVDACARAGELSGDAAKELGRCRLTERDDRFGMREQADQSDLGVG